MGVTTSKDRNSLRYHLYEDASCVRVDSLALHRQLHAQGTPHERSISQHHGHAQQGGQGQPVPCLQATRCPDDASELLFEVTNQQHPDGLASGVHLPLVDHDHLELSWICDPAARRKTSKTSYLRIPLHEGETTSLSFNVSLLKENIRSATVSLAYANSHEDLERILLERKRGNVS
jgi:hypothetical protein